MDLVPSIFFNISSTPSVVAQGDVQTGVKMDLGTWRTHRLLRRLIDQMELLSPACPNPNPNPNLNPNPNPNPDPNPSLACRMDLTNGVSRMCNACSYRPQKTKR